MSKFDDSLPNNEIVPQIISEIVALEPFVVAISCVMVMKDGSIKTRNAFMEGQKLPLLAGVTLHHNDLCRAISDDARNGSAPIMEAPRSDNSKIGIFRDHSCGACKDGSLRCVQGNPNQCDYPHARND